MAKLIKKASALGSDTVYYAGGSRWSDDRSDAQSFANEAVANEVMTNPDGKNGGWTGAVVEDV